MKITPVSIINTYRKVSKNQFNGVKNKFIKNNDVDTISFSGNKSVQTEQKYKPETRKGRLCSITDAKTEEKTTSVLNKLETRTNEVIEKANKIIEGAEKLRQTAKSSYRKGDIVSSNGPSSSFYDVFAEFTLPQNNSEELHVIYDKINDEVKSISKYSDNKEICSYIFDRTGKLNEYSAPENEEIIDFNENGINTKSRTEEKESETHIVFNKFKEITFAKIQDNFYDKDSDTKHKSPTKIEVISKSAVMPEHDGHIAYALTAHTQYLSDSEKTGTGFMQWISYDN